MSNTIYEPAEDSLLLSSCVKKYASGDVLDIGCGSGIQGKEALQNKKVQSVTFSDINKKALEYAKKIVIDSSKPIKYVESDLFSNITQVFDTIIFNPPYLPEDPLDEEKLITTGGAKGYEIIEEFLTQAKKHLKDQGIILIVFSSLSDKKHINEFLKKKNYEKNLLAKQRVFMETLYVYKLANKNENIIKGHRGIVEIKGRYAIKKALTESYNAREEAKFLKLLNKHGIGPKLLSSDDKSITMEYIKGDRIIEYMQKNTKKNIIDIIKKVLEQLQTMDKLGINKYEMIYPYKHIIIRNKNPIMIDFERCRYTQKPKNTTQFIQFLTSEKIMRILEEKNIDVDIEQLRNIGKEHKLDNANAIEKITKSLI